MTQQPPSCPGCGEPLTQGQKHNVCFSEDCRYRYWLESEVELDVKSEDKGTCLFLMLNPSKANQDISDNTANRCKEFAQQWGYKTLKICNLFARCSSKPAVLKDEKDPIGPDNNDHIKAAACQAHKIVLAWGGSGIKVLKKPKFDERVREVVRLLEEAGASEKLYALCPLERPCLTSGQPRHANPQNPNDMPVETAECRRLRISPNGLQV